ncbi:MAG: polysaccharide biosynthesis tyrosine autokinase [Candidatus Electrothrix aestuarii]|uniref:non-specific protein-tyrosine kinase n=1 Tax=Candidatus Electrothrix aestuarii TaxID=3062594 RepID=A0AAU8LRX8_9BACT|nr:polysaccharide biosynthesis tyrosine autokinase [Candidatus Electrothrix aestuarii]
MIDRLRILQKRKYLVITVALIVFLTSVLFTFSKIPVYTATTQVLVEKNQENGRLDGLVNYMAWDPDFKATQFELIRSFNVALRVVKNQHLDTEYKQYFLKDPGVYSRASSGVVSTATSFFSNAVSSITTFLSTLTGPEQAPKMAAPAEEEGKENTGEKSDAEKIAGMIQGALTLTPVRDTKIVSVSYTHEHPEIARLVANGVVEAYIEETLDIKTSTTRHSLKWMTAKANEERKKLDESERALQEYMRNNDIVTVENKLAVLPERLSKFSAELSAAQTEEKKYAAVYHQIKAVGKDSKKLEAIPLLADNSELQVLRGELFSAEQHIRELSKRYGEKHPMMIKTRADQKLLLQKRRLEIERIIQVSKNNYDLAKTRVKDLAKMMEETKAEMLNMNERLAEYNVLNRDKEMNRTVYDALSSSIKKTNVTAQAMDVRIWAVKKADLPLAPSAPKKKKELLVGLLVGLGVGIALAFFLDYLDNTASSAEELEKRYGLTVLGAVEDLPKKGKNIETFIQDNPLSAFAESYRLIRSSLLLSTPDHPPRTLLVTSMMQQEGKSTTTKNLATILAQNEKRILIVDCDMRRPRQHSMFGVDNSYGLSNYLSGNTDEQQPALIQQIPDSKISVLPSGPIPPNPAELLGSKRMKTLLSKSMERFDFVLLDSPPVQQVTDSLLLASLVDGTVTVLRAGKTTFDMLDSGIKKLRESNAHMLGLVLNRVTKKHAGQGYYGYYSYYSRKGKGGYYTEEGKK